MFQRVLNLILSAAYKPVDDRDNEQVREDILHNLNIMRLRRQQPFNDGLVDPAERFVMSSAWSLLWTRIIHDFKWRHGEISPEVMQTVDTSLFEHFVPIQEEFDHVGSK